MKASEFLYPELVWTDTDDDNNDYRARRLPDGGGVGVRVAHAHYNGHAYILRVASKPEEVGSYVTSPQFLLCQQYVHRRECMGKNKDVATTKQNEGQGCFVSKQVYLRQKTAYSRRTPGVPQYIARYSINY